MERRPFAEGVSEVGNVGQIPVPFEHFGGVLAVADRLKVFRVDASPVGADVVDRLVAEVAVDEGGYGAAGTLSAHRGVSLPVEVTSPVPAASRRVDVHFMTYPVDGREVDPGFSIADGRSRGH